MNLSVARKLSLGFGVLILVLIIATVTALLLALRASAAITRFETQGQPFLEAAVALEDYHAEVGLAGYYYTFTGDPEHREEQETADSGFHTAFERYTTFAEPLGVASDRVLYEQHERYKEMTEALMALSERYVVLASTDRAQADAVYSEMAEVTGELAELREEMEILFEAFEQNAYTVYYAIEAEVVTAIAQMQLASVVALVVGSAIAVSAAVLIARNIINGVNALKTAVDRLVQGDLSVRVALDTHDELGDLARTFNQMAAHEEQNVHTLERARREALEASRMKDLFMATMSHELRTPLNAIIGFLYLMLYSGQLNNDNAHMAHRALQNTQQLLALINNILDLSRIATGGLEIVASPLVVRQLVNGLEIDLRMLAHSKELGLEFIVDPSVPERIAHDETRLSQIITNLVSNGIKFTEQGSVRLRMTAQAERLILTVTDTGIGIPKSKQALIFDDFFQVDSSSTRQHQGAGLGLAIVRRLVLMMKGSIALESEVGAGSTFTVDLPLNLPQYQGRYRAGMEAAATAVPSVSPA